MTKILDCTIRDGGHANNWDFSDECILASLKAAELAGVDYFEAGYVMPECIVSANIKLVLMINASEYKNCYSEQDSESVLKPDCIRIACYPDEIETGMKACEDYKRNGYEVFLHLMTADKIEDFTLLKKWKNKHILTSIYFADTFGSFIPEKVEHIYNKLKYCGFKNVSFHAHNNLQLAFANTIKAIELGAYSVDGSVYGMGRGAGNLPVELLAGCMGINNRPYLNVIEKYYVDLQKKYKWGYDYKNLIGGLNNIHPREIDNFLSHINV